MGILNKKNLGTVIANEHDNKKPIRIHWPDAVPSVFAATRTKAALFFKSIFVQLPIHLHVVF